MNSIIGLIILPLRASFLSLMILFLAVAERIAAERGENIGDTVGYQVSFLGIAFCSRSYWYSYTLVFV
jgi:hypothetical protein